MSATKPPALLAYPRLPRTELFFPGSKNSPEDVGDTGCSGPPPPATSPPPARGEGDCSLPAGKGALAVRAERPNPALPYLRIWALLKVLSQKREQSTSSETGFPGCPPYLWITLWKTPFGSAKNALETGAYSPGPDFMQTITSNKTSSYKRPGFPLAYARGFGLSSGIMCISTS